MNQGMVVRNECKQYLETGYAKYNGTYEKIIEFYKHINRLLKSSTEIMNNIKKQFTFNAASGFAAQLSFVASGFIMMPFVIKHIGTQGYGIYQLAQSMLVFFMFLQIGMGPVLVRFCSQAIALNDAEQLSRVSSTAQLTMGIIGIFGMILWIVITPFFISFYDVPAEIVRETTGLMICLSFSFLLNILFIVPQGIVFGLNRYDLASVVEILTQVIKLLLVFATFKFIGPSIFFFRDFDINCPYI